LRLEGAVGNRFRARRLAHGKKGLAPPDRGKPPSHALRHQSIAQMAADKTGPTRHEDTLLHRSTSPIVGRSQLRRPWSGDRSNLAQHLSNPRFEVMRHDVTFPLYVEVDEIYNLVMAPITLVFVVCTGSRW
jgi:hypothetical protein